MLVKYNVECVSCNIAAASYCCTDIIVFKKYISLVSGDTYLKTVITINDIFEKSATFEWDDIPEYVKSIFTYVSQTSSLEKHQDDYKLFGNHIGRSSDYKYLLATFHINPLDDGKMELLEVVENIDDKLLQMLKDINSNMQRVKCL